MIDKILQFLYSLLFFITPLIMFPNTSELFEFNKMLFIYLITVLIVFFWLLKMILSKKFIFKKTPLDLPLLLFFASQILSTIFSIDRHTSLFGYYGRFNGGLYSIISYIILFYGFVSNRLNYKKILKTSLIGSLLVIVWGLPGKFGHDLTCLVFMRRFDNLCWSTATNVFNPAERMFSTLGQPNWLGAYLAINFFIGIYFLVENRTNTKYLILNTLYLVLNFFCILFTRSRSSLVAVVFGILALVVYYFYFNKIRVKRLHLIIVFFILIIFGFINKDWIIKQYNNIAIKQYNNTSSVTESLDIRKIVWKGAIDLGLKYPLFGTGVETFAYSYYFVRPKEHNLTSEWDYLYNKAHNEYLNYLATTGFIGLGTYLFLIFNFQFSIFSQFLKNNFSIFKLCLLIAYVTILITNFFGFSTTTVNLYFYLIPAFILSLRGPPRLSGDKAISLNDLNLFQWLSFFLLSSILYLLFSITIYWLADTNYAKGLNYLNPSVNDYQKATYYFDTAYHLRQEPVYEDKLSSSLAYLAALFAYQKDNKVANDLITASKIYNDNTLKQSPLNILYWKTKIKNQLLFYQANLDKKELEKGIDALNQAVKLSPNDPKLFYYLSFFYQTLGRDDQALKNINKSIELKPNYQEAIDFKAELLKKIKE